MTDARRPILARRDALGLMALAGGAAILPRPVLAMARRPFASRRISVSVTGTGNDVVLIPGLGSGPAVWNGLVADVPGYRWHRVHVRGFAGLAAEANATGPLLEPLADEIARYIVEAGLKAPPLIGHSMGGMLAMLLALRHPGRPGSVMVVDMLPSGAAMVGGTTEGVGFLARQLRGFLTGTAAGRQALAGLLRDATPGGAQSDPDVIAAALDELAGMDLGPRLGAIGAPLTVLPAVPADPELRTSILARTRAAYRDARGARIVPIGPGGHMVMADQRAKFAQAVREFLGRT